MNNRKIRMSRLYNTIEKINLRINKEICLDTLQKLTDESLLSIYKDTYSVKRSISKLELVLMKYLDKETREKIIQDYLPELIPPGTKGVIRGNRFNKIVEQYITNLHLESERFEICFEKKCQHHFTSEIPDWYILDKSTKRSIIGMNQLDLWKGGQQLNRGSKYIIEKNKQSEQNKQSKLVCVVCNQIQLKTTKNKTFELFKVGFENDTLCYLKNLQNIIYSYFNLQ